MPAFWQACLMVVDSAVLAMVSDELQAYVYMLVDPDTGVPFYVGKGHRLRHGDHVAEALASMAEALNPVEESPDEASRKVAKIKEIMARGPGSEPEVWIIRYGLQKAEYTAAEAALIDLLMTFPSSRAGTTRHVSRWDAGRSSPTHAGKAREDAASRCCGRSSMTTPPPSWPPVCRSC